MFNKILTIVLFLGVIGGGAWYVRQAELPSAENIPDNNQATTTMSDIKKDVFGDLPAVKDDSLETEALKLVARPLPIGASEQVIQKINESIDLIKSNYDYINPWLDLAAYRKMAGDNQGAIEVWNFLIKIRPTDHVAYHNLGDMYAFTLKNYAKGAEYFLEAVARNPQNVDAYIQAAAIYEFHLKDRLSEIEPLLMDGIVANPNNLSLKVALARYYQKAGNLESARLYFEKALALSPENKSIQEELESLDN